MSNIINEFGDKMFQIKEEDIKQEVDESNLSQNVEMFEVFTIKQEHEVPPEDMLDPFNIDIKTQIKEENIKKEIDETNLQENIDICDDSSIKQGHQERKRILTIEQRFNILERLEAGELAFELANEFDVSKAAISQIKSRKENIFKAKNVLESCEGDIKKKRYRGTEDKQFEKSLYTWFVQHRSAGFPINGPILQRQAMILHQRLGGIDNFKASEGWLQKFKKRHGIRYFSMQGPMASDEFEEKLVNIMGETGIPPDQIYNCDETGLYWKIMPKRTVVSKSEKSSEGIKKPKNRVTVMMCANASGTHKLKLFLIGKSKHPCCLKNISNLPVAYEHQDSAWMDKELMMTWFNTVFIPEVKNKHDLDNNPNKRILLIMDNASCHPSKEVFHAVCSFCTIVFLPPNVPSLIQPLDQGIIGKFKKCYRNRLITRILAEDDSEGGENYLKSLNLLNCANFCTLAWNDITAADIKNGWKNLIPFDDISTIECVDVASIHSLIVQIPQLSTLTLQDTSNWLQIDNNDIGWQLLSDETILFNEENRNTIEEMDDEVVDVDLSIDDTNNVESSGISTTEALHAIKNYINWYQRHSDNDPSTLLMLQEFEELTAVKILEERNQSEIYQFLPNN